MFFFRPMKMGRNFVFGCVYVFFLFVFHAKSATTNNNRTELSVISYKIPFYRDSKDNKNVEISDFWSIFELIKKVVSNFNSLFRPNFSREILILRKQR